MSPDARLTISVASTGSKLVASGATGPLLLAYRLVGTNVGKKISKKKVAIALLNLFWVFIIIS
jgi:hypothetical protein